MLHHWHAQILRWTRCSNYAVRRLGVFWGNRVSKLKTTVYHLHGQLTVFSLPGPQVPQWSSQTVHCFRPLRVSRLTHIHTLVFTVQHSSIPWCQFCYLRPIVPSIIFRLQFTLYCFCHFLCLFQPWCFRMQPQTLGHKGTWWLNFTITVQCQIIRDLPYSAGETGCKRCSPGHLRNRYMFHKSTYLSLGETWPSPLFSQISMLFL